MRLLKIILLESLINIMFRSNREIYRAYNKIQNKDLANIRLRIQGESEQFTRIKEIAWMLDFYKNDLTKEISNNLLSEYRQRKTQVIEVFPNWDKYNLDFFECLLLEYENQKEDISTHSDLIEFINEICQKDDGQLSKIYYKHYHEVNPEEQKTEVVLTTMHKVKGLEFDAVLIPPSFSDLDIPDFEMERFIKKEKNKSLEKGIIFNVEETKDKLIKDYVEEERRLMFVALTRARFRLVFFIWKREQALIEGNRFSFPDNTLQRLGIPVQTGFEKFFISWGAKQFNFNNYYNQIENDIKQGDTVTISKNLVNHNGNEWTELILNANNILFGRLTNNPFPNEEWKSISGFSVSGIYRYTYKDTIEYDKTHFDMNGNNTTYANNWCPSAVNNGYIYLIEFSGYGTTK